ncbi:related to C-4 methyl sterol oxidase [Cephalotrichum gorgonifer]|uniref:Related to C-4 methyl sterol oxidase n=1 Tax=Cephalotrichum gorgonifer TaxID=2041049 RepID=A0AAE8N1E0_9PEZI|nr:related to C-4 methyl sterol oxidase [Cephalotrichum gorgonifer]
MDLLLSLPLVSTLLTPSWSTSINILFFYATWSTLVLTNDASTIHGTALLALRIVIWLAPSLLFLAFDSLVPSLSTSIKFVGAASIPRKPLRLLSLAVSNMLLVTGVESALAYGTKYATGHTLFRTTTTLPLPWQLFKHIIIMLTARETLTYYIHRFLLHDSHRSHTLTRLHTRWGHANQCSSIGLYADHPLPLLMLRLVPILLPALALRPHLLTYMLFTAVCTVESTVGNSGYSVVPGILLGGIARRTAAHYASGGKANYGTWGVLDWVHGTSRGGDIMADVRDEADKHNVKDRSARKVDEGVGVLQGGVDALKNGADVRKSGRKRGKGTSQ